MKKEKARFRGPTCRFLLTSQGKVGQLRKLGDERFVDFQNRRDADTLFRFADRVDHVDLFRRHVKLFLREHLGQGKHLPLVQGGRVERAGQAQGNVNRLFRTTDDKSIEPHDSLQASQEHRALDVTKLPDSRYLVNSLLHQEANHRAELCSPRSRS